MNNIFRPGIRGRMFLAFGTLSTLTLLASIVGWMSHNRLGGELNRVVDENIQALSLISDLKEQGTRITIMVPALMAAKNEDERQLVWLGLNKNIETMRDLLQSISEVTQNQQAESILLAQTDTLQTSLGKLNSKVNQRLAIQRDKLSENQRLRWVATGFLSDIDTLIQDVQKNLYSRINQDFPAGDFTTNIIGENAIMATKTDLQTLYRIKADVNLLISLVDRAQHLPDLSSLIATRIHSDEVVQRINNDIHILDNLYGAQELRQAVVNIVFLTKGDNNMFTIRREERSLVDVGTELLNRVHGDLEHLNQLTSAQVKKTELAAQTAASNAEATINKGQIWMLSMVGVSLLLSILIVWLYVGRNMVGRITRLDASMRSIADGNLHQAVSVKGEDEIGAMARSLLSFRDQLSDLQEELVQAGKLAALGQLSAGIAHEINQPLSAIGHYSHNGLRLIKSGRLEDTENNFKQISSLTKRATTIITRLKSMARKHEVNLVSVELRTVVDNVLNMLEGDEVRDLTTFNIHFEQAHNQVLADPIQLEQVILNLVTNALDAISVSPKKEIGIDCLHKNPNIEIHVRDNGPGIDPELRGQIFDPFFTTKRIGQNLGLGLAISFNIVKNFNGKLTIDTDRAIGASFCIRLPKFERGTV